MAYKALQDMVKGKTIERNFQLLSSIFLNGPGEDRRSKKVGVGILIVLVALGIAYWLMVVQKEQYLIQRNFRLLNLWSHEIGNRIESYEKVFELSLKEQNKLERASGNENNGTPQSETYSCNNQNQTVRVKLSQKQLDQKIIDELTRVGLTDLKRGLEIKIEEEGGTTNGGGSEPAKEGSAESPSQTQPNASQPGHHQHFCFQVNKQREALTVDFIYLSHKNSQALLGSLALTSYLKDLTNEPGFEDVLLFDQQKKVIFQKASKEYSWSDWGGLEYRVKDDSWFAFLANYGKGDQNDREEGDKRLLKNAPQVLNVQTPHGSPYVLFTQPIHFASNGGNHFYLGGIIASEKFRQSYLAISSTVLLFIMTTLLGLLLAVPLIRLNLMGITDPLKLFHIFTLFFSMMLSAGLLTLLLADLHLYLHGKHHINEQMKIGSESIKQQLTKELRNILYTLKEFDSGEDYSKYPEEFQKGTTIEGEKVPLPCTNTIGENPNELLNKEEEIRGDCYPDYQLAFWMNKNGILGVNWAPKGYSSYQEPVDLMNRKYVSTILKEPGKLWSIPLKIKEEPELVDFYIEPIISWTTGVNTVVASIPHAKNSKQKNGKEQEQESQLWVAAMEFQFLSLMNNVVLPPGIGFAVVDNKTGKVQFHSRELRNLKEDFFVETDQNYLLRDLVFARKNGHVDGKYWGNDTHFYVLPLEGVPWTLVTFRDKEMLRSVNLVILVIAGGIFMLWALFLFCLLWGGGWCFKHRDHRKAKWLWPEESKDRCYQAVCLINVLLFFVGLLSCWFAGNSAELVLFLVLIVFPGLGVFLVFACRNNVVATKLANIGILKFLLSFSEHQWLKCLWKYPRSYAFMLSSFLLIFSVLPAIGTMRVVFQQEMTMVVKHQLLKLHQELQEAGKPILPSENGQDHNILFEEHSNSQNDSKEDVIRRVSGFYPNFFLDSIWETPSPQSESDGKSSDERPLARLYQLISEPFVPLKKGVESWGLIHQYALNNSLVWTVNGEEVILSGHVRVREIGKNKVQYPPDDLATGWNEKNVMARADLPILPWILWGGLPSFKHVTVGSALLTLLMFLVWVFLLYRIPRHIADRTLFLAFPKDGPSKDSWNPDLLKDSHSPNVIILGYPGQGKTRWVKGALQSLKEENNQGSTKEWLYLNLKTMTPQKWISTIEEMENKRANKKETTSCVIIDQLEFRSNEPLINQKKLELFEWLLYPSGIGSSSSQDGEVTKENKDELPISHRRVHVLSNTDPSVFPLKDESNEKGKFKARWNILWESFGLTYFSVQEESVQDPSSSKSDFDRLYYVCSPEAREGSRSLDIPDKARDEFLRPHYYAIWQSLTVDEMLALFHLARDRFIHVEHPGLHSLLCKGLLRFNPDICFSNPSFREFVEGTGQREQLDQLEETQRESRWAVIKMPLGLGFLTLIVFLLFTQEEFRLVFPALISILPVLFQGLPGLPKIVSKPQS